MTVGIGLVGLAFFLFRRELESRHRAGRHAAPRRHRRIVRRCDRQQGHSTAPSSSWNGGAERLYGYTAAEVIGRPILCCAPRNIAARSMKDMERLRHGQPIEHFETTRIRKDGRASTSR